MDHNKITLTYFCHEPARFEDSEVLARVKIQNENGVGIGGQNERLEVVADGGWNPSSAPVPFIGPHKTGWVSDLPLRMQHCQKERDVPTHLTLKLQKNGKQTTFTYQLYHRCGELRRFKPPSGIQNGPDKLNILLFGLAGATKSSFINTVLTCLTWENAVARLAGMGGGAQHATTALGKFDLKFKQRHADQDGEDLAITLWDTWGLTRDTYSGKELDLFLEGRLPGGWTMKHILEEAGQPLKTKLENTRLKRIPHAVLFFFPQGAVDNEFQVQLIQEYFQKIGRRGYNPIVMLTRVDEVEEAIRTKPFDKYPDLETLKATVANKLNIPSANVHFNVNYVDEDEKTSAIDMLVFRTLRLAASAAASWLNDSPNAHKTFGHGSSPSPANRNGPGDTYAEDQFELF